MGSPFPWFGSKVHVMVHLWSRSAQAPHIPCEWSPRVLFWWVVIILTLGNIRHWWEEPAISHTPGYWGLQSWAVSGKLWAPLGGLWHLDLRCVGGVVSLFTASECIAFIMTSDCGAQPTPFLGWETVFAGWVIKYYYYHWVWYKSLMHLASFTANLFSSWRWKSLFV